MESYARSGWTPILIDGPGVAQRYLVAARSLFNGLAVLARDGTNAEAAATFLAGQALEGALKAHLASVGYSGSRLSHAPFGHNLEALWFEAATHGLDLPAKPPEWCSKLNDGHREDFSFHRSLGTGDGGALDPVVLTAELAVVLTAVGKTV